MEEPLVQFKNVTKRFGDNTVLDGTNLEIYSNQVTTIIGKSGGGKSVLLKHIIGLLTPDSGEIFFRGKPLRGMRRKEWDEYRSIVSYMFQGNALFDSMTVFDNIALPLAQTTLLQKKEIAGRVLARMEQMDLADVRSHYPSELSGGMQKRVALARALVTDPEIVLFDEPTTGQDPIRKNAILSMIAHYRKKFGFTAVLISHDIPDVFFISDRILLLWEGKISFQGTYEAVARLRHPMVDEFLQSLEGFQDELTGLLSKGVFRSRYAATLGGSRVRMTVAAILFGLDFEHLEENLGFEAALSLLKSLAERTNRHFSPLGGFSARYSRDEILTILPHTTKEEASQLLDSFSKGLSEEILPKIEQEARKSAGTECFDILVHAGVGEGTATDTIDGIIETAKKQWRIMAQFRCNGGGDKT
jgi:phospholipid/cholesterol/gamma-HCH transport system ATP-binding protein